MKGCEAAEVNCVFVGAAGERARLVTERSVDERVAIMTIVREEEMRGLKSSATLEATEPTMVVRPVEAVGREDWHGTEATRSKEGKCRSD